MALDTPNSPYYDESPQFPIVSELRHTAQKLIEENSSTTHTHGTLHTKLPSGREIDIYQKPNGRLEVGLQSDEGYKVFAVSENGEIMTGEDDPDLAFLQEVLQYEANSVS